MTRSNNTTRARAHEAKVDKVLQAYKRATGRWPETSEEIADAHDRAYRTMWSGADTEPEDSFEDYFAHMTSSLLRMVVATAITCMSFGLGLGYLLFHP